MAADKLNFKNVSSICWKKTMKAGKTVITNAGMRS
jgi:hypothetical protein